MECFKISAFGVRIDDVCELAMWVVTIRVDGAGECAVQVVHIRVDGAGVFVGPDR